MTRPSNAPLYNRANSTVLWESKHIIRILRKDGTRAIGTKTKWGMRAMEKYAAEPYFKHWKQYRLAGRSLYLMEEIKDTI